MVFDRGKLRDVLVVDLIVPPDWNLKVEVVMLAAQAHTSVKRCPRQPGQEAQQRLQESQKALELAEHRLAELEAATAKKRRQSLAREAERL